MTRSRPVLEPPVHQPDMDLPGVSSILNSKMFQDPSEPIYTDPSLFERSRSLRSIALSQNGHTLSKDDISNLCWGPSLTHLIAWRDTVSPLDLWYISIIWAASTGRRAIAWTDGKGGGLSDRDLSSLGFAHSCSFAPRLWVSLHRPPLLSSSPLH